MNKAQIETIRNIGLSVSNKIEGGFLNKEQSENLQREIESNYIDKGPMKFGQDNNDIRMCLL